MIDFRTRDSVRTISGPAYKLMSAKGTLLGTLTIPSHAAERLRKFGAVKIDMLNLSPWKFLRQEDPVEVEYKSVFLVRSYHCQSNDGVEMHGISIEELERQPGFSFSPSAAYLRSLLE